MRPYVDLFQMAKARIAGIWKNECKECSQTEGMNCEPVSRNHPIGKCPGFVEG